MNENRRSNEASSLRTFFDDQLHHLHSLVENMIGHAHYEQPLADEEKRIVESFVDAANVKMRAVNGFAEKLRTHVCSVYNHVLEVAEEIPSPVNLNQESFAGNPLVNALFVNTQDIDRLFQANFEVRAFFKAHEQYQVPVVYALLTASKTEKAILGVGMLGDMLVREVRQETVNFSSHKIHMPCTSETELSTVLRQYMFDRIVTLIRQEMAVRMNNQIFEPGDKSYESRINSLVNPDVYLNTLLEYLEFPDKLLSIDKTHFRLSKLGIKLNKDDSQRANEFDIHELTWSDGSRNVMLQISYRR